MRMLQWQSGHRRIDEDLDFHFYDPPYLCVKISILKNISIACLAQQIDGSFVSSRDDVCYNVVV